jgi:hypothetical protein
VPDGEYELELLFAETMLNVSGKRIFDVLINDSLVIERLDLAATVGPRRGFSKWLKVSSRNGLSIKFVPRVGEPILNGIRLTKLRKSDH